MMMLFGVLLCFSEHEEHVKVEKHAEFVQIRITPVFVVEVGSV